MLYLLLVLIFLVGGFVDGTRKPNILLFLTDDQDLLLGSMEFMPKTLKFMRRRGVEFENTFVSTPICCPSRSTILTGIYAHTHNVMTNNHNCSGLEWRTKYENTTFGVHLKHAGYRTAYFGKYLNEYEGTYVPPGWSHWMGLIKNSRYYNYTLNYNGKRQKHGFDHSADYLTDLITNETLKFIEEYKDSEQPFLIVLSYPAPHGPEDPAPQFNQMFEGVNTHKTASWNYAPNPDKQWLLQHTGKMEAVHVYFTDLLHRRRLQTLQSVDDSVHRIMNLLRTTDNLQNTYSLFTSDHGYHLGQFGLIKGKSMPYEFDIRVPFFIRGPGLPRGAKRLEPIGNIDLAPTLLAIANVNTPSTMHGRSILELFHGEDKVSPWRQTMLIERGKMPKLRKIGERVQKQREKYSKFLRIARQCSREKYSAPCKPKQDWICLKDLSDRWRIHKCRTNNAKCNCRQKRDIAGNKNEPSAEVLDQWEDEFLQEQHEKEIIESGEWFQGVFASDDEDGKSRQKRDLSYVEYQNETEPCLLKSKLMCEIPVNVTRKRWDRRKSRVDVKIQKLRDRLSTYKKIRKVLKMNKPLSDNEMEQSCQCEQQTSRHPLRTHFANHRNHSGDNCTVPQMNCFTHGPDHWKTPPFWPPELGSFCFCQNSNNNTYWCLRTVNSTHNFLYCEFVTGFISFYDLNADPNQLTNTLFQLDNSTLTQLNQQLLLLKSCRTGAECEHYSSANWHRPLHNKTRKGKDE